MTVVLRRRASVFHAEGGWFSANWHFSFDQYWDEANMGLGDLRVFNDDRLVPGAAWPMHPHRDIEGITYVAEGTFEDRKSTRLNSSHGYISYAVFCLKKKKKKESMEFSTTNNTAQPFDMTT